MIAPRPHVAVIGAGVGGIACAYRLKRAGFQTVLFEKSSTVGGRTRTIWRNGFGFDTGAGALPSTSREVHSLLRSLGIDGEIEKRGATIGVYRDRRVERVCRRRPQSLLRFGALSTPAKLSLWRLGADLARIYRVINPVDLSAAAQLDTQTIREYAESRFSEEVFDYLLAPLARALFLVEPEQTSVVDLFAAVKALLLGSSLWTHRDGIAFFVERAARELNVHYQTEIDSVYEDDDGVEVTWRADGHNHQQRFDAVVLAIPARDILRVHRALDSDRAAYLKALDYSSSIVVNIGVGHAPNEESSMVLVPRSINAHLPVVALGHNLAPGRVPPNAGIITAFWMREWSRQHWHDSDESILAATRESVNDLFPNWVDDVREWRVTRWSPALVASRPGTYADLRQFAERSRRDRLIQLAGDFHAQTSINASVGAGQRAAADLVRILRRKTDVG